MKKVYSVILIIVCLFMLCACGKEEVIIPKDETRLYINERIASKGEFDSKINEFKKNLDDNYSIIIYSIDLENNYGMEYALYNRKDVTELNYLNYDAIATFSVYFDSSKSTANLVDLLYTFPISYDGNENNLKIEYSLYTTLINSLLPGISTETYNDIIDYFDIKDFQSLMSIFDKEKEYDYKTIDMGEGGINYMSTLYLKNNKRITLEYHDSSFEIK